MPSRGKVVLFFPSYATEEIAPPIALISIAGPLMGAGFEVVLVDSSVTSDYLGAVLEHADDAVALGISIITGPMIREAIEVGRAWKARNPDAPVIMGGWHASILPEQTLAADFVDVVVEKQGEVSMLELCEQLVRGDGQYPGLGGRYGEWPGPMSPSRTFPTACRATRSSIRMSMRLEPAFGGRCTPHRTAVRSTAHTAAMPASTAENWI